MNNNQLAFAVLVAIITFTLQKSLTNIIAGILLKIARPFKKGDNVSISSGTISIVTGRVKKVGLISTLLHTYQKEFVTVPNGMLLDNYTITNHTKNPKFNQLQKIEIPLSTNVQKVKKLIKGILIQHRLTYNDERNTKVLCKMVSGKLEFTYNVKTLDLDESYIACDEILEEILLTLKDENLI